MFTKVQPKHVRFDRTPPSLYFLYVHEPYIGLRDRIYLISMRARILVYVLFVIVHVSSVNGFFSLTFSHSAEALDLRAAYDIHTIIIDRRSLAARRRRRRRTQQNVYRNWAMSTRVRAR